MGNRKNIQDRLQSKMLPLIFTVMGFYLVTGFSGCNFNAEKEERAIFTDTLTVTASAYNSLKAQGEGNPNVTSFGDTLYPGLKSIAVSRDLVRKGLTHGTPVKIEGFEGVYIVNDKMHPRWRNKIDIYMGVDREKARRWGRKKLKISFPGEETNAEE